VCVSSQAGCALGCTFCATGAMGPGRNLTSAEIFDQAVLAAREAQAQGARLANVVFMGMGEPMQNLDPVLEAHVERSLGRRELLAEGFAAEEVDLVLRLVDAAEWKRRQYPLGPKVTTLAFGRDRQLPVTSAWREPASPDPTA